jgi:cytochrome c peroxidase
MSSRRIVHIPSLLLTVVLVACGGGGDGGGGVGAPPPAPPPPANRNPVLDIPTFEEFATVGLPYTLDATLGGTLFSDPDGDRLTYEVIFENSALGLAISGTTVSGIPSEVGTCLVKVRVTDGRGGVGQGALAVRVRVNEPPKLLRPNGHAIVNANAAIDFDPTQRGAAFHDPENQAVTYTVSILAAPSGFSTQGTHIVGRFDSPGYVRGKIEARDGLGGATEDLFALVVPSPIDTRPQLPAQSYVYEDRLLPLEKVFRPDGNGRLDSHDTTPADNPITNAGATLGRVLFYDKRLSITNTHACASCHEQARGFASSERFPPGALGVPTHRSPMSLTNVRFNTGNRYFSDERSGPLEQLAPMPIEDRDELGNTMAAVENKLAAVDYYPPLFTAAFGSPDVTSERISRALAQFLRSMISYRSKFDAWRTSGAALPPDPASILTPQEGRGFDVFIQGQCFHCHMTPNFEQPWAENNGIDETVTDPGNSEGRGKFRVASLRNVAVSGPYMHDGRFATLRDVIEHYDNGIKANPALSIILGGMATPRRLNLSEEDKLAFEAFLNTFTDNEFLTDPKFSDPFQ